MRISFDFDSTLQRPEVQAFAQNIGLAGMETWIVTSRSSKLTANTDLFEVALKVGIPKERIIFTNYEDKAEFLKGFAFHYDDDPYEIEMILSANNGCVPVLVPLTIKSTYQLP